MSEACDNETLRRILTTTHTIAVVGLSDRVDRPSHEVARFLMSKGYTVIPVNPRHTEILGQRCYARLEDIPCDVDMVDLFQRSEAVMPFVESAIAIGARTVWMQIGVINEPAAEKARASGLEVVMDLCPKIEYARLLG